MGFNAKIAIRVALLGGISYVVYRNWDKITGKLSKLSRMNSMDEVIEDLAKTTDKAFDGIIDTVETMYEYVVGSVEEQLEPINEEFWNDVNAQVEGLPARHRSYLKGIASDMVYDIRQWDDPSDIHYYKYTQKGSMPIQSFVTWHNFLMINKDDDFRRVKNIIDVMLQYNYPEGLKVDTKRNPNLPTLEYYVKKTPTNFLQTNEIDWQGRNKMHFSLSPRDLFIVLGDKIRNTSPNRNNSGLERLSFTPNKNLNNMFTR